MKVLVTGGSGFVGKELVKQLVEAGHRPVVLARNVQRLTLSDGETAREVRQADVLNLESLRDAGTGIEAVIHLVGIISEVGRNTFEAVHVHGTQNLLAAAGQWGVTRFVHMSALGTRPNAVSRYHQTKWAAEECVRASGLRYTIFRPSLIFGPNDDFVNAFARLARFSPFVPVLGRPTARFQPVAVEAVAKAFAAALTTPAADQREFDLCGPETLTLPEIIDAILAATRRKRMKVAIPPALASCQARFLEFVYPHLLRQAPPFSRDQLLMLQEDNMGDGQPAQLLFNLEPVSFRQGIKKYLR